MNARMEQVAALKNASTQMEAIRVPVTLATNLLRTTIHVMVSATLAQMRLMSNSMTQPLSFTMDSPPTLHVCVYVSVACFTKSNNLTSQ